VLFLGNLIPIKNASNLIKAMKNIPNNYKLEICGEGREKRKLENFVNRNFLDERIIFSRPIFNKDLIYKFENNDILVIPSFSESFSRLGLESLINGLPLVLTQNSPLINFFSEDIIKIDPKSPQSIAEGIILASKTKLDSRRANYILKNYFSAKEYAKNFVNALEIQN
jgi:glycosyltransferase involved in cell wall biosynthesis